MLFIVQKKQKTTKEQNLACISIHEICMKYILKLVNNNQRFIVSDIACTVVGVETKVHILQIEVTHQ